MKTQPTDNPSDYQPDAQFTITNIETLRIAFDPKRSEILGLLAGTPRTVKELAEKLETNVHKLYYHIHLLEEHNLIRVVETRMVANMVEKYYQITATQFLVDPKLTTFTTPEGAAAFEVMLSTVLDDTKLEIRKSVRRGLINPDTKAPETDALLIRRGFFKATPSEARKMYQAMLDIAKNIDGIEADDPSATQMYAFAYVMFPTSNDDDDTPDTPLGNQ